ncbi:unnamed protein product [Bursaphelenchus okinawaensis]|uniref:PKD_channel domain-containing protein n=1 Tax=Bursaphelenchus okinawaensis TaxID=465554 RepID=A0A811K4X8_9BILA|nr:unnamed protein product [Bursaphelenchus okinawaensis]CAG9092583.1 unnamed protein product [Bursaphelenchus okinawaensis]
MPLLRSPRRKDYDPIEGLTLFEWVGEMPLHRNHSDVNSAAPLFGSSERILFDFNTALEELTPQQKAYGERLRRHLQFFFLDPVNKFKLRRQFPFKLALQILKVLFVSVQLMLFADLRINHVDFLEDTVTVMRHKFLKDWDHERDAVTYPPEAGRYSVFTSNDIIEHISHIVSSYYSLQNESFASFSYDSIRPFPQHEEERPFSIKDTEFDQIPAMRFCVKKLADVRIENHTYIFDISMQTDCSYLNFTKKEINDIQQDPMSIRQYFKRMNVTFRPEDALIIQESTLSFNLRTIHFSPGNMDQKPECYLIEIVINFDNSRHTGQVFIHLDAVIKYVNLCNGRVLQVNGISQDSIIVGVLDILVLAMCLFSLLLCCRALFRAQRLKSMTEYFFETVFKVKMHLKDELSFLNMWYVMIVVNDVCIVIGTVCKIAIEFRDFDNSMFTLTGVLLGIGCLLVYIGLFRYLGFFNQYNVLILTLKRAIPSIGRFLICTVILYVGFLIAGWVIIGPYSIKFRTLAQSSEALFSLMNGDDMFATFYTINDSNATIKLIGTLYIYIFVCLFIYVVLSLFIAIIMDAYEVVRESVNRGVVVERSSLQEFLASVEIPQDLGSGETRELFAQDRLVRLDDVISDGWRRFCGRLNGWLGRSTSPTFNNFQNPAHDEPVFMHNIPSS